MTGKTLMNLVKFQACLLVIMLIFAKVNGASLSDSFYIYLLSVIGLWAFLAIFAEDDEPEYCPPPPHPEFAKTMPRTNNKETQSGAKNHSDLQETERNGLKQKEH